jgi:adenosyl cobinamide kinase/adenosyl cobinamide phosphate guanylyltransferase
MATKSFDIEVCRISYAYRTIKVTAETIDEAKELALDEAGNYLYNEKTAEYVLTDDKSKVETLTAILDDIQKDLADYQNEIGIGMCDDNQWQQMFVDRVIASISSYEYLKNQ